MKRNIDVTQLISGFFLLFIGFGFITNILTLILIWILDPIPDELFYSIFNIEEIISGISPENPTNSLLQDLMKYLFGLISYIAFLQITLSIWFMASHRFHIINPNKIIFVLLTGLIEGILFGFSKCFYFMITI